MSWKKFLAPMLSAAFVGVLAVSNGCSSSSPKATGGGDAGEGGIIHRGDAGGGSSGGAVGDDSGDDGDSNTSNFDGTTGNTCSTDTDCRPAGGPGVNQCTSDAFFGASGGDTLFPTAVCLLLQNCTPTDDNGPHYCDGPDDPSSPGICLSTSATDPTKGICLPKCNFKADGSAPTGCQGKDACNSLGFFGTDANSNNVGIGFCEGGCDTDADCASGQHCQTDEGICLKTVVTVDAGELAPGTGCNTTASTAPMCNCIAPTTGAGYCGQFCVTGRSECGAGYVCEAQLPLELINGTTDASEPGWATANPGMAGWCAPTCELDGGADGGSCTLANSTCQSGTVGGPDCEP